MENKENSIIENTLAYDDIATYLLQFLSENEIYQLSSTSSVLSKITRKTRFIRAFYFSELIKICAQENIALTESDLRTLGLVETADIKKLIFCYQHFNLLTCPPKNNNPVYSRIALELMFAQSCLGSVKNLAQGFRSWNVAYSLYYTVIELIKEQHSYTIDSGSKLESLRESLLKTFRLYNSREIILNCKTHQPKKRIPDSYYLIKTEKAPDFWELYYCTHCNEFIKLNILDAGLSQDLSDLLLVQVKDIKESKLEKLKSKLDAYDYNNPYAISIVKVFCLSLLVLVSRDGVNVRDVACTTNILKYARSHYPSLDLVCLALLNACPYVVSDCFIDLPVMDLKNYFIDKIKLFIPELIGCNAELSHYFFTYPQLLVFNFKKTKQCLRIFQQGKFPYTANDVLSPKYLLKRNFWEIPIIPFYLVGDMDPEHIEKTLSVLSTLNSFEEIAQVELTDFIFNFFIKNDPQIKEIFSYHAAIVEIKKICHNEKIELSNEEWLQLRTLPLVALKELVKYYNDQDILAIPTIREHQVYAYLAICFILSPLGNISKHRLLISSGFTDFIHQLVFMYDINIMLQKPFRDRYYNFRLQELSHWIRDNKFFWNETYTLPLSPDRNSFYIMWRTNGEVEIVYCDYRGQLRFFEQKQTMTVKRILENHEPVDMFVCALNELFEDVKGDLVPVFVVYCYVLMLHGLNLGPFDDEFINIPLEYFDTIPFMNEILQKYYLHGTAIINKRNKLISELNNDMPPAYLQAEFEKDQVHYQALEQHMQSVFLRLNSRDDVDADLYGLVPDCDVIIYNKKKARDILSKIRPYGLSLTHDFFDVYVGIIDSGVASFAETPYKFFFYLSELDDESLVFLKSWQMSGKSIGDLFAPSQDENLLKFLSQNPKLLRNKYLLKIKNVLLERQYQIKESNKKTLMCLSDADLKERFRIFSVVEFELLSDLFDSPELFQSFLEGKSCYLRLAKMTFKSETSEMFFFSIIKNIQSNFYESLSNIKINYNDQELDVFDILASFEINPFKISKNITEELANILLDIVNDIDTAGAKSSLITILTQIQEQNKFAHFATTRNQFWAVHGEPLTDQSLKDDTSIFKKPAW